MLVNNILRHFKRHLHLKCSVVHQQLHVIQNTAHRPSTPVSYTTGRVKRKISCSGANCSNTHNIISSIAPYEFNVILRTTMDEFNVLYVLFVIYLICPITQGIAHNKQLNVSYLIFGEFQFLKSFIPSYSSSNNDDNDVNNTRNNFK